MTQQKKLKVSCALCDMTGLTEEVAASYDSIEVRAALAVVSPEAKTIIARHGISIKAASVCEAPSGAVLTVKNGSAVIGPGTGAAENTVLMVNGSLTLEPGCEDVLRRYARINVNGSVLAPQSLSAYVGQMEINGSAELYPDGAVLVDHDLTVDGAFMLRAAENALYYVDGRVLLLDGQLELSALLEKNVRFEAKNGALVRESLMEQAAPLFDANTELTPFPEGFALAGKEPFDEMLVRRLGKKLWFSRGMTLDESARPALEQAEELIVCGTVWVPAALRELFLSRCVRCKRLEAYEGKLWKNDGETRLTAAKLRRFSEGVTIVNDGVLTIEEGISPEAFESAVRRIVNDGMVLAKTPELLDEAEALCEGDGVVELFGKEETDERKEEGVVSVKAASYRM